MTNALTSNIVLDQLISVAITGDKEALQQLRFHPWFTAMLAEISRSMSFRYRVDAEEIRDHVFDKLSAYVETIKNPNNSPLTKCLRAWSRETAKKFCLNEIRHDGVEQRHFDRMVDRENSNGTRKSVGGGSLPLQPAGGNSPEDVHFAEELRYQLGPGLSLEVRRALVNCSPEIRRIVVLWADVMTLKGISEETRIPLATVARHLSQWQKQVFKRTVLGQIVAQEPKRRMRAYELLRDAIRLNCAA